MQQPFRFTGGLRTRYRLGTLGPSDTSSAHTARRVAVTVSDETVEFILVLFPNFEELRKTLEAGNVDVGLVPHAWRDISDFYFTPAFHHLAIFRFDTPTYGLVSN